MTNTAPSLAFGKRLRELRLQANINQRDLGAAADLDFTYISKIENGVMGPPATASILRLAAAIGCDSDELLALAGKIPDDVKAALTANPLLFAVVRACAQMPNDQVSKLLHDIEHRTA